MLQGVDLDLRSRLCTLAEWPRELESHRTRFDSTSETHCCDGRLGRKEAFASTAKAMWRLWPSSAVYRAWASSSAKSEECCNCEGSACSLALRCAADCRQNSWMCAENSKAFRT